MSEQNESKLKNLNRISRFNRRNEIENLITGRIFAFIKTFCRIRISRSRANPETYYYVFLTVFNNSCIRCITRSRLIMFSKDLKRVDVNISLH